MLSPTMLGVNAGTLRNLLRCLSCSRSSDRHVLVVARHSLYRGLHSASAGALTSLVDQIIQYVRTQVRAELARNLLCITSSIWMVTDQSCNIPLVLVIHICKREHGVDCGLSAHLFRGQRSSPQCKNVLETGLRTVSRYHKLQRSRWASSFQC